MGEEVKWLGVGLSSDLIFQLKVPPYPRLVAMCVVPGQECSVADSVIVLPMYSIQQSHYACPKTPKLHQLLAET